MDKLDLERQHDETVRVSPPRSKALPSGFILALVAVYYYIFSDSSVTSSLAPSPAFHDLHHSKLCPDLQPISLSEFSARRTELAQLLTSEGQPEFGAYIAEPSPNTLYYTNLSTSDWYLSERPWLVVVTPERNRSHLTVLTPAFELSRSQRLPFALNEEERNAVSWVVWQEAEDPYAVLLEHLDGLRKAEGASGSWTIHIEENVRQFISYGLSTASAQLESQSKPDVRFAALKIREQRMRKTTAELAIQKCAGRITIEALRAVRKQLKLGMTEMEGDRLITDALTSAGLTSLDHIVLFGENAALPHASASETKRLQKDEFALFDVGGNLFGYQSDFTRTMLPDPPAPFAPSALWSSFTSLFHHCPHNSLSPPPSVLRTREGDWPSLRAQKIWESVSLAQRAALASLLSPNTSTAIYAANVDRAARDVLVDAGYGEYFTHRVGHGIGLQVHEHPYLNSGNFQALLEGETFSNEPGAYIEKSIDPEGLGIGVRLEDMVLKTEKGWELLSGEPLARSPWSP